MRRWTVAILLFSVIAMAEAEGTEPTTEQISSIHREMAPRLCSNDNGEVISACIEPMLLALEYSDEYMRSVAMKTALQEVIESNRGIKFAKKRVSCSKRGFEIGQIKIGMSRVDAVDCGWGFPLDERRVTDRSGVFLTYSYPGGRVLHFFNDKVSRIHE